MLSHLWIKNYMVGEGLEKTKYSILSLDFVSEEHGFLASLLLLLWIRYQLSLGPFEFFTIAVSVRLSDRSLHREEQKKIRQKLPPVGIETRTSWSSGQYLTNWARQDSVGQEVSQVSFVCFMHHFTCWTLFISRINGAWLYKGHEDSVWQLNVDLAQLLRH